MNQSVTPVISENEVGNNGDEEFAVHESDIKLVSTNALE